MAFRYLADPLFLACLALFVANRWLLEPMLPGNFCEAYVNDLICLPFCVPPMLWGLRRLGLRSDDAPPRWYELLLPLMIWSAVFEVWLPRTEGFRGVAVADPTDILCYALGGIGGTVFWRWRYRNDER